MIQMNAQLNVSQLALLVLNASITILIILVSFCIESCDSNMVGVISFHCFFLKNVILENGNHSTNVNAILVDNNEMHNAACLQVTLMLLQVHVRIQLSILMQLEIITGSLD